MNQQDEAVANVLADYADLSMVGILVRNNETGHFDAIVYPGHEAISEIREDITVITMLTDEDYKKLVRQMDMQEKEIFAEDGKSKMVVRKSQRRMDQMIAWEVFARDNYTCRYCGGTGIPMTYDHVKLWENLGENSIENGITACRPCNKKRGNMDYVEWLNSAAYRKRSNNLDTSVIHANDLVALKYMSFPDRISKRRR